MEATHRPAPPRPVWPRPPPSPGRPAPPPASAPARALRPIEALGRPDVACQPTLRRACRARGRSARSSASRKSSGDWLPEGRGVLRKSSLGWLLRAEGEWRPAAAAAASEPGRACEGGSMAALWAGLCLSL